MTYTDRIIHTGIKEVLEQRRQVAEANCPEGMELVGWLGFEVPTVTHYPQLDALARPVYAYIDTLEGDM